MKKFVVVLLATVVAVASSAYAQSSGDAGGLMDEDRILKEIALTYELAHSGKCERLPLVDCASLAGADVLSWPWIVLVDDERGSR